MSFIEQEINSQPEILRRLINEGWEPAQKIAQAIRDFDPVFVMIAARGTSDNAGRYAQYLMGIHARLPVALATPSVHTLYESAPRMDRALVLGISQSGQSEDIRRVISDARQQGALTVSLTNAADSPMAHETEYHLDLMAGTERSIAATKSYTAQLTGIALLTTALLQDDAMLASLHRLPELAAETLRLAENMPQWVERYRYMERFALIGRGYNYATAFEISLKIKELCYLSGVEYSEADFRHGPIAVVQPGFPVMVVAPQGKTLPYMVDLLGKLHEKEAECLVISNDSQTYPLAQNVMPLPQDLPEWLSPITAVIPGQIFAMRLAMVKGHSVDAPKGLQKVTITA
jgi:glucosamine--fructose-6-phosphate aminotransferase (isomerizing)